MVRHLMPIYSLICVVMGGLLGTSLFAETYSVRIDTGEQAIVVAINDTLMVTSGLTGLARIYEGCGTIGAPFPVTEEEVHTLHCTRSGHFSGTISDAAGTVLGSLTLTVVSTNLASKAIADQVGMSRPVIVQVSPADAPLEFVAADPTALDVSNAVISGGTANMVITALRRGTPILQARILGPAGLAIVDQREIDEFTLSTPARADTPIDLERGIGTARLEMHPFIPDLAVTLTMFAHTSTFDNGATSLSASTNDFQAVDDSAGDETIGVMLFDIHMPADEDKFCFSGTFFQDDPIDVGRTGNVNGHGCKIDPPPVLWTP